MVGVDTYFRDLTPLHAMADCALKPSDRFNYMSKLVLVLVLLIVPGIIFQVLLAASRFNLDLRGKFCAISNVRVSSLAMFVSMVCAEIGVDANVGVGVVLALALVFMFVLASALGSALVFAVRLALAVKND